MELSLSYKFSDTFVNDIKNRENVFKNDKLAYSVYKRTYSRVMKNGNNEEYIDTIRRVVEGTYSILKNRIKFLKKEWNEEQANKDAEEMFESLYKLRWSPPGRGLWCMGTDLIHKKGLGMAANNCAFISTENILDDPARPFEILMDMSMCGTGVGFDTKGANRVKLYEPVLPPNQLGLNNHRVHDSREGWTRSVRELIESYTRPDMPEVVMNYDDVRAKGELLKTFGGVSSGPEPLIELHSNIRTIFEREMTKSFLSSTGIVDLCNVIGVCVVSGGIRRTALIGFGEPGDNEFLDLKNYDKNPHRMNYGWTSNNSIFAEIGQDYTDIQERICNNGEPGIAWLENMQKYSRLCDPPDWKDRRVRGGNPCLEQSLEPNEVCCLVENFIARHDTLEEYLRTQKFSYLYAKAITLIPTHIEETNRIVESNRRIGSSISGIAQFLGKEGNNIHTLRYWCKCAYDDISKWDDIYSKWLEVPKSIKKTSIKPSGTVSILAGATPGIHFPHSRYYIRTVRFSASNPILEELRKDGLHIEPCQLDPKNTHIVSFPIDIGECKTLDDVTMWEQLEMAATIQEVYADNQVSCTVTFRKEEGEHIAAALNTYQYRLKGISFLPRNDKVYPQMPYQKITKERYIKECQDIINRKDLSQSPPTKRMRVDPDASTFCDGDLCHLDLS